MKADLIFRAPIFFLILTLLFLCHRLGNLCSLLTFYFNLNVKFIFLVRFFQVGMGHKFLKHVERTRMLIFVVDVHGFRLHPHSEMRSAFDTLVILNRELELYNSDLLEKPCLCLVNKMDLDNSKQALDNLESELLNNYEEAVLKLDEELRPEKRIVFDEIIPISAKRSQKTVNYVKDRLRYWIDENDDQSRSNEMSLSLQEDVSQAQDSQTPMLT